LNVRTRKQIFAIATALLGLSAALFLPSVDAAPGLPLAQVLKPRATELPSGTDVFKNFSFGTAVAVRNDVALVGMPGVFAFQPPSGAAVAIFTRDATGIWRRTGTLRPIDTAPVDGFGKTISYRDNIAIIGANRAAYVFRRTPEGWKQTDKLAPPSTENLLSFAHSLDHQDGAVTIGATFLDPNSPFGSWQLSSVYAFEITSAGKRLRTQKLVPSDSQAFDNFGIDVCMTHDTVVVGAPIRTGPNGPAGAAYVFKRTPAGWVERQKLIASDSGPGGAPDRFGWGVAIDNDMIIVGAPGHRQEFTEEGQFIAGGAAYIFTRSAGVWAERDKLRPTPEESGQYSNFGEHIVMFGGRIAITSRFFGGLLNVYQRVDNEVTLLGVDERLKGRLQAFTSLSLSNYVLMAGRPIDIGIPDPPDPFDRVYVYNVRQPLQ
jgi:hypothetical protein